jgi:hypothetical protein
MITPVAGIQHLVSLTDSIVCSRPRRPPLVIAVTSEGDATAREFVDGYHKRLSNIQGESLVPHALGGKEVQSAAARRRDPDVALLDMLAEQLRTTVPAGAGRRWRPQLFQTCLDVMQADGIAADVIVDQRRKLLDHLYGLWEERTPLQKWVQDVANADGMPSKVLGLLATAVFSGPSRWWFGRTLNSRRRRWFGDHVKEVTGHDGDFLSQALHLLPEGSQHGNEALRRRILLDALLRDVDRLVRRRHFLPDRRRRRWTPVLGLDCTAELRSCCYDLVQLFVELTTDMPRSPLLVIAALEQDAVQSGAGHPDSVTQAAERLRKYVDGDSGALPHRPWLPVLLTSEPVDETTQHWLESHCRVTPKIPGRVSAWAPVVATTVLALTAATGVTYPLVTSGCRDTWTNASGERVGVIEENCEFTPVAHPNAHTEEYPNLQRLEAWIRKNNSDVDQLKDSALHPHDFRKVVFFAPLTRPDGVVERTEPANALWQLQGAIKAQEELNGLASQNASQMPIKLILANSGDHFEDGPAVAATIAKQPHEGPGSLAAVIGISQSRQVVVESLKKLSDIAVIGASMYGNHMTDDNDNFFMAAPPNDAFAEKMAQSVTNHEFGSYRRALIVYDRGDTYFSKDLRDSLRKNLTDTNAVTLDKDVDIPESPNQTLSDDIEAKARQVCRAASNGALPLLVNRADQLKKLFAAGDKVSECRDHTITMLAGPGAVVDVASGDVKDHRWLDLRYTSLADTAPDSDRSTGNDALQAASRAINKAAEVSGNNTPNARGVLFQLRQDDFEVNSRGGSFKFTPDRKRADNPIRILRAS